MPVFEKYRPGSEKELHSLIENDLDAVENGLICLQREFNTGLGLADFLCVDSGGTLVVIEVKLSQDENVLFQSLRYYGRVIQDKYIISSIFPDKNIDPGQDPRIILIAVGFSEDIRKLCTLVVPEIELLEYTVVKTSKGVKGMVYHSVTLPQIIDRVSRPVEIDEHRLYIQKKSLHPIFDNLRILIKDMGEGIEEYSTQSYVGYKFQGRQFAWIRSYRNSIVLGAHIIDEDQQLLDYENVRIENADDDYSEIHKKILEAYNNLGGVSIVPS